MKNERKYWFPAKSYGWGWGFPTCWQGVLVLLSYLLAMITLPYVISPAESLVFYLVIVVLLSLMLLGVCYVKGEPPRWRSGKTDETKADE